MLPRGKAAPVGLIRVYLNPSNSGGLGSSPLHTSALLSEPPAGSRNVSPNALMEKKKKRMLIQGKQFQAGAHLRSHHQGKEIVQLKPGAAIFFFFLLDPPGAKLGSPRAQLGGPSPTGALPALQGAGSQPQEPCFGLVSVTLGAWPPPSTREGDVCQGGWHK